MSKLHSPALLFEMMRSFATLAHNLNLSETVRELGSTRQTVRRHIATLEEYKGDRLFTVVDRQYQLTDAGNRSLREAEELIARGDAWLNNQSGHIHGLFHLAVEVEGGTPYFLQQHRLGTLWTESSPLMQLGFHSWAAASGEIEHPAFAPIRPYLMIFRLQGSDWICVEVGSESSYATWFGWRWERSSVGRGIAGLPGGPGFANLLAVPFQDVMASEALRLDHIHTHIPGPGNAETATPISYQRLLMGCRFPDGSFALAALIDRTHNIRIEGLDPALARAMPTDLEMNVTLPRVER